MKGAILGHLERWSGVSGSELVEHRLRRFRKLGVFHEADAKS